MKKILKLLIVFTSIIAIQANAKEDAYYTNKNNVNFTKEQYEFFSSIFYEGYQDLVTQQEFDSYPKTVMNPNKVNSKYLNIKSMIQPFSTSVNDTDKTLKISTSSSSTIVYAGVTATWKVNPNVRSYDVIGAYLSGIKQIGSVTTRLSYSSGSTESNEIQVFDNGFGVSAKLPSSGNNIVVSQSFSTTVGGTIYASYQHATSYISLANSKCYTIGKKGYGNVFVFNSGMESKFDAMAGVDIDV